MTSACSKKEESKPGDALNISEPVTLNFLSYGTNISSMETTKELITKKFPNIQVEMMPADRSKGTYIDQLITSGNIPDLISWPFGSIEELKKLQLMSDLTPLIKKHKFDLNRLAPGVVEAVKSFGDNGEFPFMPYTLNNNTLFYNKDIFDKFAIPYPKENMTWEEIYDLSKKFSILDNGIQYIGFLYSDLNLIYKNQMGLPFVDPKTHKALVNTDQWRKWMEIMSGFHKISGSLYTAYGEKDLFIKEKRLAMRAGGNIITELSSIKDLNWDVVSFPHFSGYEPGSQINVPYYVIPSSSKKQDAAFQVMDYLLSDEVQTVMSRKGQIPVVRSQTAMNEFGKDVPGVETKNLQAFFKDKVEKPINYTPYDYIAKYALQEALKSYGTTAKDINTVLRETEEKINKSIEVEKNK